MPTLNVQAGSGLTFAWTELAGTESLGDALFENDNSQVTMQILIKFNDRETAVNQILGYSFKNVTNNRLNRVLPMKHPDWYWYYATAITGVQHINPLGKITKGRGGFANYEYTKLTIRFNTLPYRVRTDIEVGGDESQRFIEKRFRPSAEILSSDRGQWFFQAPAPSAGTAIKGSVGYPISKGLVEMIWHNVAKKYVLNDAGIPSRLMAAVNKVNDAQFQGFPPGTLLLQAPDLAPIASPFDPQLFGLEAGEPARMYRVTLPFLWFDPPTTGAVRGHVLAPDPASATGQWFEIKTTSGRKLFESIDMTTIFLAAI